MHILVEVSARHIHLSREDIDILFGKDYQLQKERDLSQGDDFAAKEKLTVKTDKASLSLRVVGKERQESQIELSRTDAINLGVGDLPLRTSGHLDGVPKLEVVGPQGKTSVSAIVACRHLHLSPDVALEADLRDGDKTVVKIEGERKTIFENVVVRVQNDYTPACHLDTDEGNACGLTKNPGEGEILL